MQTYANICMLGAITSYCFTDAVGTWPPKVAKNLAIAFAAGFVVTEGMALLG